MWFEPTDLTLASKPLQLGFTPKIDYISPNFQELCSIVEYVTKTSVNRSTSADLNSMVDAARKMALILLPIFPNIIVTLGKHGLLVSFLDYAIIFLHRFLENNERYYSFIRTFPVNQIVKNESGISNVKFYHTETVNQIKSTSGAGDW